MASILIVSPLPLTEQSRALKNFLAQHHQVSPLESALHAIVTSLELTTPADAKIVVKRLRTELKAHRIEVAQSHGYEAIARLCGFSTWMQACVHFSTQPQAFSREGVTMRLVPADGETGPFQAYESLPKLATEIIQVANDRIGQDYSLAFCTLLRGRKGLRVEFELQEQLGFSFDVLAYRTEGEEVQFVDLDSEAVHGFASRLERAIEKGHPGAIVSGTVLSTVLPHWYHPQYVLKSLRQRARDIVVGNEMQLFVMLEGVGVGEHNRVDQVHSTIYGNSDDIRIEPLWVSQEDGDGKADSLTSSQFNALVQRFLRFKHVLRQPFREVMMLLSTGTTDTNGYFTLDKDRLVENRELIGLTRAQLAKAVGISILDLVRIEKYGHAHEAVIDKLAKALGLGTGNALLPQEASEGTGIRLESADNLILALADTHSYRCIISDHFADAEKEAVDAIAENIKECGDLVQISEGVFDEVFGSKVDVAAVKESLQCSLNDLAEMGGAIVVSRSLHYARGHERFPGLKDMPMHSLTMFFEKVEKLRTPGSSREGSSSAQGAHHG